MEKTEKSQYLAVEKIPKLLLKFSIPCILSLLVSALYNIIDQIFIGNSELGYLGNAATGIVFPILIISLAFAWCFGDGAAAFMSLCQGKKDTKHAHKCVGSSITFTLITSAILVLIFFLVKEPMLRLFGASDQTIGMASEYFTIVLSFLPVFMLMNMMNSVIRADGSPGFAMASIIVGAVLNIILDPIFIFVLKWGMAGAAWATVIGQVVSLIISVAYFFKSKTFRLTLRSFIPDLTVFCNVIKFGLSTFITQMSIVVVSLVSNIMLAHYGALSKYGPDIPISVISIETKVFTIVINIVVGLILGGQPIIGYNYGAKKYHRVKETYRLVMIITIAVGLIATIFFEAWPELIIGIFGSGSELYEEFAVMTFRIFLSLVTFTCIIKVNSIFFQAVGQPVKSTIASLTRDIVCFVPLVLILPNFQGVKGILIAAPISDAIAMVVTVILTIPFFKNLKNTQDKNEKDRAVISSSSQGVIITIAREHGTAGKEIGRVVAEKLKIPYYSKELTALAAQESGLDQEFINDIDERSPTLLYDLYLSTEVVQIAIRAQDKIIRAIADRGSAVIVGRAADYVLRENNNLVSIFIHAPIEYRIQKVMEMYGDSFDDAAKQIKRADEARGAYYRTISGKAWGDARNYDMCIDSSIGVEKSAEMILDFISRRF